MRCRPLIFLSLVLLLAGQVPAQAEETVSWPYFVMPPMFIMKKDTLTGFGPETVRMLSERLPEYEHQLMEASPKRMFLDCQEGKHMLLFGLYKTDDRQRFLVFSALPVRFTTTSLVAMHAHDAQRLAPDGEISPDTLINRLDLRFGFIPGITHGQLESLAQERLKHPNVTMTAASRGVAAQMEMLKEDRVDWIIFEATAAAYLLRDPELKADVTLVRVTGVSAEFMPGYVAAPRTPWGKRIIRQVNHALVGLITSGDLYRTLMPWIPANMRQEFTDAYEKRALIPARKMAGLDDRG